MCGPLTLPVLPSDHFGLYAELPCPTHLLIPHKKSGVGCIPGQLLPVLPSDHIGLHVEH